MSTVLSELLFEFRGPGGEVWKVWADGRFEGFPGGTVIVNKAAPLLHSLLSKQCGPGRVSCGEQRHEGNGPVEPVADIDAKLRALNLARAVCFLPRDPGCWCARCDMEHNVTRTRMSVCNQCGDKRCPRAEDHRNECHETPNV